MRHYHIIIIKFTTLQLLGIYNVFLHPYITKTNVLLCMFCGLTVILHVVVVRILLKAC